VVVAHHPMGVNITQSSIRSIPMALAVLACACATREESGSTIVRPGAPGQPSRVLDPTELEPAVTTVVTRADVTFMQGMIAHHTQALAMSRLVPARVSEDAVRLLAQRIERSQRDEIAMMERWLETRGEEVPDREAGHQIPSDVGEPVLMPGMLTDGELGDLERASGTEFDRLFLVFMIRHHEGALTMVRELFESAGAGQEGVIFRFAVDVDSDQRIEIARMIRVLAESP